MDHIALANEIRARASRLRDVEDGLLAAGEAADDAELLICLARVLDGKDITRAFGSPGDWGYNTPIGRALAAPSAVL
jgi:hypothetical protein